MRQIGTKAYCQNCAVKKAWSGSLDSKICTKLNCKVRDNMRCPQPQEAFEQAYTLEQVRKHNHHK